jgi:accessory Sec system protein Asp3
MIEEKWTVYWNEYSSDTYLYGSEIDYHGIDDVEFRNNLMPSGTIIKQWYSKTNYQRQRIEPSLPIIDGESRYQITVNIDCMENEAWLARLVFFDKYDVEAGYFTIRNTVSEFKCPLKTYSYRLQLINGGMTHFHFHSIVIREIEDETDKKIEKIEKNRKKSKRIRRKNGRKVR